MAPTLRAAPAVAAADVTGKEVDDEPHVCLLHQGNYKVVIGVGELGGAGRSFSPPLYYILLVRSQRSLSREREREREQGNFFCGVRQDAVTIVTHSTSRISQRFVLGQKHNTLQVASDYSP